MDQIQQKKKGQKYNLRPRKQQRRRIVSDDGSSSSEDEGEIVMTQEEMVDDAAFKKFLYKMFPSKHMKTKIKEMDAITEKMDAEEEEERRSKTPVKRKKKTMPKRKNKKIAKVVEESEEEEESEAEATESGSDDDSDFETYDEDDDFDDGEEQAVINIVLNISEAFDEDEEEDESEDEDYEPDSEEVEEEEEQEEKPKTSTPKMKDVKMESALLEKIEQACAALGEDETKDSVVFNQLKKFTEEQKEIVKKQSKKVDKKAKDKHLKEFKQLINERRANSEVAYFNKLEVSEQRIILDRIKEANKHTRLDKPYRFKMLDLEIPEHLKSIALKKMTSFQKMEPGSGEYFKLKNWIDAFMSIPFNTYRNFDISLAKDGQEKCREFMAKSTEIMDDAVYGLNDAKMQIMQMMGTWITNPNAVGNAVAIKGPPGTGKTTLVKEGISKVLGRPFAFIALGGSTDSSFLEGHGYTYEGSTWGKIVSILMESKCMNPVIYFDELDKVSDTPKGEEIIGILTHLIDTSQNSEFHDKYFSEIKFDLSKCLFIFSYNDESKINPILKDRMYKIETKGYDAKEKAIIARKHLLPAIRKQIDFKEEDLVFTDEVLSYIVQNHTGEEKGVRNLKRCLEVIYTKMNLSRFTDTTTEFFKKGFIGNVEFPYTITNQDVDKLIVKNEQNPYLATLYT
jgi:ATP-dependent Lon protease